MQNSLLKYLKSESKKSLDKRIFDIVIYGSYVKSKKEPNDIDIVIVFFNESLNERLSFAQEFKNKLKEKIKNLDIKAINLPELFDKNFLARAGITSEGYSLLTDSPFSLKMGFKGYSLFS